MNKYELREVGRELDSLLNLITSRRDWNVWFDEQCQSAQICFLSRRVIINPVFVKKLMDAEGLTGREMFRNVCYGLLFHEVGHYKYTLPLETFPSPEKFYHFVMNVIEDCYIERPIAKAFGKVASDSLALLRKLNGGPSTCAAYKCNNENIQSILYFLILRNYNPDYIFPEIPDIYTPDLLALIDYVRTISDDKQRSDETIKLAEILYNLLKDKFDSPQQPNSSGSGDGQSDDSQDKNQDQQGDGQQGQGQGQQGDGSDKSQDKEQSSEDDSSKPKKSKKSKQTEQGKDSNDSQCSGGAGEDVPDFESMLAQALEELKDALMGKDEEQDSQQRHAAQQSITGLEDPSPDLNKASALYDAREVKVPVYRDSSSVVKLEEDFSTLLIPQLKRLKRLNNNAVITNLKRGELDMRKLPVSNQTDRMFKKRIGKNLETDFIFDILIDASGSMGDYTPSGRLISDVCTVAHGLTNVLNSLKLPYRMMFFSSHYAVMNEYRDFTDKHSVLSSLACFSLRGSGGGTNLLSCLVESHQGIKARREKDKVVIVLTDGEPSQKVAVVEYINDMRKDGIVVLGIGLNCTAVYGVFGKEDTKNFSNLASLKTELPMYLYTYLKNHMFKGGK